MTRAGYKHIHPAVCPGIGSVDVTQDSDCGSPSASSQSAPHLSGQAPLGNRWHDYALQPQGVL